MAMKSSCALALLVTSTLGPISLAAAAVELELVARSPPTALAQHPKTYLYAFLDDATRPENPKYA